MSAAPRAALAALTARRLVGDGLWIAMLALGVLSAQARWAPDAALLPTGAGTAAYGRTAYALTLGGTWSLLLLAGGPWLLFRAAGVAPRWRRGELDWLASAPVTRGALTLSAGAGLALAALGASLGLLALCGLAARAAGGPGSAPGQRLAAEFAAPQIVLVDAEPVELSVDAPPGTEALEARVFPVGAAGHAAHGREGHATGGSASVRLAVERSGARRDATAPVGECTSLRVTVPDGSGPLRVALARAPGGPLVALDAGGLRALEPSPGALAAPLALFWRTLAALGGWCALALGLGAWMGARLAGLLTLSGLLLAWLRDDLATRSPLAGLDRALAVVGEGLAPAGVTASELAPCAGLAALGLALARAGLVRGGSS